ncbi:MAG: hypothetical protein AAF943_01045 [Pseudomonadota bacterium]
MELIADILLVAGALGAGLYCVVLGRRLNRFNDLEKGVGGAVAVLSAQVDELTKTLEAAQKSAAHSAQTLEDLVSRSEKATRTLEMQMASLHDFDISPNTPPTKDLPEEVPPVAPQIEKPIEPMFTRRRA